MRNVPPLLFKSGGMVLISKNFEREFEQPLHTGPYPPVEK